MNNFIRIVIIILLFQIKITLALSLQSPAFKNNQMIPAQYTCDNENISPPLQWSDVPQNTKSFVLICDDPDTPKGVWDHWLVFNIPGNIHTLKENTPDLPNNVLRGMNSYKENDYRGPCPPSGMHRYFFKLYALDAMLPLKEGASKNAVEVAMKDLVLEKAVLVGTYKRRHANLIRK